MEQTVENPLVAKASEQFLEVRTKLEKVREEFSKIKINGVDDADGYVQAKTAAKAAGELRRAIEARKKVLKEESLAISRSYDQVANELQAIINPIEEALKKEIAVVDDHHEKEKLKKKNAQALITRKEQLSRFEHAHTDEELLVMSDLDFVNALSKLQQAAIDAQNKKIAEQQADNEKIEREARRKILPLRRERLAEVLGGESVAYDDEDILGMTDEDFRKTIEEAKQRAEAARMRADKEREDREKSDRKAAVMPVRRKALAEVMRTAPGMDERRIERDIDQFEDKIAELDEAGFSKMLDDAKAKAKLEREEHEKNLGESQKIAMWIDKMLAVERPVMVEGSIHDSSVTEVVEYLEGWK